MAKNAAGFSTLSVHAGEERDETGALEGALSLSSAFHLGTADEAGAAFRGETTRWLYGRWGNPTTTRLERKVAALEGAEDGVATASGMAAVSGALLASLRAGDHLVAPRAFYGESARLVRERLPELGIRSTLVDATDLAAWETAIEPETRAFYAETPANPTLAITDLGALGELAKRRGLRLIVDNTFATPYAQTPLEHGAHLVVHSLTKALGGHGDAIGGMVVGSRELVARVRDVAVKSFGGMLAPFNAYLIARGIYTLSVRQERACASALEISQWLATRPEVETVRYPGLATHPGHEIAARQMRAFGSLVSFELRAGIDAGKRLLDRVELVSHAVSLGDVRTLITHPASTTASYVPRAVREAAGISDGLLRLSIGLEDVDDLIADLTHALAG